MNASEKRAAVVAAYKTILGRNIYSQDAAKRECCFTAYKDGKYYSDCSSSIRLAYKKANIGLGNIGGNTVGMYQNKSGAKVECAIKSGVPTDVSKLRVGDILLFAGNDKSRAYADYVGHVEMVAKISGNTVTLYGHGSGNPKAKAMAAYCKSRQSTSASTPKGNRGLLKVVRFIPDEVQEMTTSTKQVEVTGDSVNVRTGAGTNYKILGVVKKGTKLPCMGTDGDGWFAVQYKNTQGYISGKYSRKVG